MKQVTPFGVSGVRFRKQIEAFRKEVNHEMHILQMIIFVEVVNNPQHTVNPKYIKDLLAIIPSSASRHCKRLTNDVEDGYGLCQVVYGHNDYISKYLELTKKGEDLADTIRPVFQEAFTLKGLS
ncbi:hypothetical protein [Candidatus Enterovibrio escicola]|uniref:MarR family transcriptional regulator n=1 Tax=Candidatus Enterovibrio escicola TaxID=1927127 RepID=A0A2A5T3Z5_9GAMM|nr:hypothetical protein [Candidatus Enterovibrio escacola]PCS22874.1 hypothetical protein BTN49_1429 [Candidatus Enterovibrio escacola]